MAEAFVPCFHCGESCPDNPQITIEKDGQTLPVCCQGCRAVAELILGSGLGRFYRFREGETRRADQDLEPLVEAWRQCDERESLWGVPAGNGLRDLLLQTEGVQCAACAWLIRSRLEPREGISRVQVDVGTGYTRIEWDPATTRLSTIAGELARLGYRPHLPLGEEEERGRLEERRNAMLRLGVAGLGMMQVMMYAVGLYAGEALGISAGAERFLEWTSLLVSIPVVFYSGRPFFENALASLANRSVNMDVPVALAIGAAFIASCVNFLRGAGEVYFDSAVMFIFFLSAARYVQLVQRHRNLQSGAALARLLPEWSRRLGPDGIETVLVEDLRVGDQVRVPVGEPFPADGRIQSGETRVDESLLTGESRLLVRGPGAQVVGGSINRGQPVDMTIEAIGSDNTVSALGRMLLTARSQGSRVSDAADRLAGGFVVAVLLVAASAGVWWSLNDPGMAFSVALSVLVVSCPCALSLATPAALAAASRQLLGEGVLMTRSDALEALAGCKAAVFDKTGTLTRGEPRLAQVHLNPARSEVDTDQALQIASALEAHSAHPLAGAFAQAGETGAEDVQVHGHQGVSGCVNNRLWRIGSAAFTQVSEESSPGQQAMGTVWLADDVSWVARFDLDDSLRPGSRETLDAMQEAGWSLSILSGDEASAVKRVAEGLGVSQWRARQDPAMKMSAVDGLQAEGRGVLMVGDGVNDAPVLASADVSMSVQGASELANSAADFILTRDSLAGVLIVLDSAANTRRVIRQNLAWAIGYNVLALPLAVGGYLEPWMAALGMSLSSLLVVANSARLARGGSRRTAADDLSTDAAPA